MNSTHPLTHSLAHPPIKIIIIYITTWYFDGCSTDAWTHYNCTEKDKPAQWEWYMTFDWDSFVDRKMDNPVQTHLHFAPDDYNKVK
jgi:hypothetical protein